MRPAYWTSRPLNATGAARKRGVEGGAVEAFTKVGAGRDNEQRRSVDLRIEAVEGGGAGFRAHAAA